MNKTKVSVIIPTHNRSLLLKRAIDSVIEQSYTPYEIVVVDDSNCLDTQKLIKSYDNKLNVKLIINPNTGASSSRNYGAIHATGEYISFLDDDDMWLPNKLEKQINKLKNKKYDAIFTQLFIKYENRNLQYKTKGKIPNDILKEICMENFIGGTITSFINREFFLMVRGFDENFPAREEYDLWIRLIKNHAAITIVEEPLVIANRSLDKRKRISANINNYIKAIDMINKKHNDLVNNTLSTDEKKTRTSKQYEFLAAQAISIGLRKESFIYYSKSFINRKKLKPIILSILSLINPILVIKIRCIMDK
ncbi:glycosyltransferase family 2 protein [Xenorhabdus sp. IM139775]|uniref:glycosyltransferase family 2 protein n=1 Tax=Xenorhabdus sp. IM139775 TaxID=3025876 RepID=UPI002358B2D4|nr:glycosyltransferase family A protein [Xenorhabdus sp. IM139775]MDC9592795.1 glycosyltransferase family A protein [Xenorhabdus sp. IM139775]